MTNSFVFRCGCTALRGCVFALAMELGCGGGVAYAQPEVNTVTYAVKPVGVTVVAEVPSKVTSGNTKDFARPSVMQNSVMQNADPLPAGNFLSRDTLPSEVRAVVAQLDKQAMGLISWRELEAPLRSSLVFARRWNPEHVAVRHSGLNVTWGRVVASLELLQHLLPRLDNEPELLGQHFQWYSMAPDPRFTAYYSPVIEANPVQTAEFTYPIYRLPEEIAPHLAQCLPTHTCPDEAFSPAIVANPPHHTRAAIDLDQALAGRGLEMAWLAHPADVYHLMLEGSGLLRFPDGTQRAALFAGLNGHRGKSMAGTLIREHKVPAKDTTHEGIRRWWDANPAKRRALLEVATGYVFFRYGGQHPQGSIGAALTPWLSMAVDERVVPLGSLVAYGLSSHGKLGPKRYGIGFAQDTGMAIVHRRVDMYTGEGQQAKEAALQINHQGDLWVLLQR